MMALVAQKLALRAKQAEEIISQLKVQIETVKQAAAINVSKPEEERLRAENELLRTQINGLKTKLIMAEIKNGVKQVPLPSRPVKFEKQPEGAGDASKPVTVAANEKQTVAKETKPKDNKKAPQDGATKTIKPKVEKKAPEPDRPIDISRIDFRVGKIVNVKKHPDADSLYVEEVDLGEGQPRTIVSGLVKHVPIEEMQGRLAVFMCNLKAAKMRGILSNGMIMCANCPEKVEILLPPPGAQIGDRVVTKGFEGEPDELMNPKKKIWETVKPDLVTNDAKVATYKGAPMYIPGKGEVIAPTRANTQIS